MIGNKTENKPKKSSFLFTIIKFLFFVFLVTFVIGLGVIVGIIKTFSEQLPEVGYHTYKPKLNTKIYDANNNLIAEFHEIENRTEKVKLSDISLKLQQAFLAIEDARFYDHYGIDFIRIIGAALTNWKSGTIKQGASTITQQLARNAFLTQEQTFTRKIKEILLAFKIEQKFSKQEIFELYLNEIYFGHGAWGVASAAEVYFGKKPADLSLSEAAILAGIPKNPTRYDPFINPKRAKERQILVLNKMLEHGFITKEQADAAKDAPIHLRTTKKEITEAPYFVEYVRNLLVQKFGPKKAYTSGLKVYTTIDMDMQKAAEQAFLNAKIFKDNPLDTNPTLQGALIAIDPQNGHIKAMVGGRSFEKSEFNRAVQAKRQPGSTFKTFIYTAAIQMGMSANTVMIDEPIEKVNPYTGKVWRPANYENKYFGAVTLKTALEKSLNSIAVKLLEKVGVQRVIDIAHKMGIKSQLGNNLSLALGACDVTPLEIASAYGVIANGGIRVPPVAITKIVDNEGNILYESSYKGEKVLEADTAYVMTEMLKGVIEQGTGRSAKIDRPAAGKTGTTNNYIDAWFIGFTPNLVCAIYVGNDDRKPLGSGKSGGRVVAPIWREFMLMALKDKPIIEFKEPGNIVKKAVCKETGLLATNKCPQITQSFKRGLEPETFCTVHDGLNETLDNYFVKNVKINNNVDYTESENDILNEKITLASNNDEDNGDFNPQNIKLADAKNNNLSTNLSLNQNPINNNIENEHDEIYADDVSDEEE